MPILSSSTKFGSIGGIINAVRNVLPINVGVPESIASNQPPQYIVKITVSDPKMMVTAFIQDKFVFNVQSDWEDAGSLEGILAGLSDASQFLTGHTLVSTMTTRRKWRGSSPITLTMKLKFEAFEDVEKEVIAPCEQLQSLVLPSAGLKAGGEQFFVIPPGPNPFYIPQNFIKNSKMPVFSKGQEIRIDIGNFITFKSIVVSSVEVSFESRMAEEGPVGAEALVTFQTYEMLTKERLLEAYKGVGNATRITEAQTP